MKKLIPFLITAPIYANSLHSIHSSDRVFYKRDRIRSLICKDKSNEALSIGYKLKQTEKAKTKVVNAYINLSNELSSHAFNGSCSPYVLSNLERKFNVNLHSEVFEEMVESKYQLYNKSFRPGLNILNAIEKRETSTLNKLIDYEKNSNSRFTKPQIDLLWTYNSTLQSLERNDFDTAIKKSEKILKNYDFKDVEFEKFNEIQKQVKNVINESEKKIFENKINDLDSYKELKKVDEYIESSILKHQGLYGVLEKKISEINSRREDKIKLIEPEKIKNGKWYRIERQGMLSKLRFW